MGKISQNTIQKNSLRMVLCLCYVAIVLGAASLAVPSYAQVPTQSEIEDIVSKPVTKINIPGLSFSDIKLQRAADGNTYINIPFLGEYIAAVFKYGIFAISIIAVVMMIRAGLLWVISGGDATKIGHAKEVMVSSVVGIIISVGSYTLLYTINPDLVNFKSLRIQVIEEIGLDKFNEYVYDGVKPEDISSQLVSPFTLVQGSNETQLSENLKKGLAYGFNGVPYFGQYDPRWGKIIYGNKPNCSSFTSGGCGPSSFAMVLTFLGKEVNPTHIGKIAAETDARVCGQNGGTNSKNKKFLEALEQEYNVTIQVIEDDNKKALDLLRQGKPLIVSGAQDGYTIAGLIKTYAGHYMVLTGTEKVSESTSQFGLIELVTDDIDQTNQKEIIRINDPGNRVGITYMTLEQFDKKDRFIYISNNGS